MSELVNKYKRCQPYIITIFITISLTTFVMKGSSVSTFVENFNFASTLTSIILSIIAILITLIEGAKSSSILDKIADAASNVDKSTSTLNDARNQIEEFINKLSQTEDNILNETKSHYEKTKEDICAVMREHAITIDTSLDFNLNKDFDLENFLWRLPHPIRQHCLFIYKTNEYHISSDIYDFNNFFNIEITKENLPGYDVAEGILNTLYILQGLNLIEFSFDDDGLLSINFIDENFKQAIEAVIPKEDYFADSPDSRFFGPVYEYFNNRN